MSDFSTPPGWYPDGEGWERRWDGSAWTEDRRRTPAPQPFTPPAAPTPWAPPASGPSGAPPSAPPYGQGFPPPSPQRPPAPTSPPQGWSGQPPYAQPAQPAQPGQGQPAYGPPGFAPPARRKRPVALLVALGLVRLLVVGAGVTLAILRPWAGDEKPGPVAEPKPKLVTGDFDGDGHGDVRAVISDETGRKVTGLSDGSHFTVNQLGLSDTAVYDDIATIDLGHGKLEQVTYTYDEHARQLSMESDSEDFGLTSAIPMAFSSLDDTSSGIGVTVDSGDFDGDGNADLVVWGQHQRTVDVYVLKGHGDGKFDAPAKWASIPNAQVRVLTPKVGDFDGDGRSDLFGVLSSKPLSTQDYRDGFALDDLGTSLFRSTGTGFTPPRIIPVNFSLLSAMDDGELAGHVTDAERDSLVVLDADSVENRMTATAYDVSSGAPVPEPGMTLTDTTIGDRALSASVLSDVDGDGLDDVVYLAKAYGKKSFLGFEVMLSKGNAWAPAARWGDVAPCAMEYCSVRSMQ